VIDPMNRTILARRTLDGAYRVVHTTDGSILLYTMAQDELGQFSAEIVAVRLRRNQSQS